MKQNYNTVNLEPMVEFIRENVGDDNLIEHMGAETVLENIDVQQAADFYGVSILDHMDRDVIKFHLGLAETP